MQNRFFRNLFILTKPGIARMQLITVGIGYILGGLGVFEPFGFFWLLVGTYSVASGAGILNHYIERDVDKKMNRTKNRPLPQGDFNPTLALFLGVVFSLVGIVIHLVFINSLTAFLSFITVATYILVYTPLKQKTWLNTFVGAFPGAMPILGGWAAATGNLHVGAWVLFVILFTWQHPHFYALGIMYKDDYERGGFQMLPVIDTGQRTIRQILVYTVLMIFSSVMPVFLQLSGWIYGVGILVVGMMMFGMALNLAKSLTIKNAKRLFIGSVIYLPVWFLLILLDFYI